MNAYVHLQAAKGIGAAAQRAVLSYVTDHHMELGEFLALPSSQKQNAGLTQAQSEALSSANALAQKWQQQLDERNITVIGQLDTTYPDRLKRVLGKQAPPVLYVWGNLNLLHQPAVGFCGSRNASDQGIQVAQDTAYQVTEKGWIVVSGHARGIDTATHHTALANEGATIIVLPEGILNAHLRTELRALAKESNVLIVSEFQPNARWSVANAMTRNRTICGLSDALVVIESGATGGTFEAGKFALSAKVPLFVVEYAQPGKSAAGNPYFLQKGAQALRRHRESGLANMQRLFTEVASHYDHISGPEQPQIAQQSLFAVDEIGF